MKKYSGRLLFMLLSLFGLTTQLYAQKEAAVWLFDQQASFNFNASPALYTQKSMFISAGVGTASICNSRGELLFWSDGLNVYDAQNQLAINGTGLRGRVGSPANFMIIPAGTLENKYYFITADSECSYIPVSGSSQPIPQCYFIYDTTTTYSLIQVGPNKEISVAQKNIPLLRSARHIVTATLHANGVDTWLVTADYHTSRLYAFLFTECGVTQTVVSDIMQGVPGGQRNTYGPVLLLSPNGKKLAFTVPTLYTMDFDNATGIISNRTKMNALTTDLGLAFSPNSKYLYVCDNRNTGMSYFKLKRFHMDVVVCDSLVIPLSYDSTLNNDMRLAIDGNIYINGGDRTEQQLCMYKNSDDPILSKQNIKYNLVDYNLDYDGSYRTFPNFITNYFDPAYALVAREKGKLIIQEPARICEGEGLQFRVQKTLGVSEYRWDFGDGESAYNVKEPLHVYTASGSYVATLIVRYTCQYDTIRVNVRVDESEAPPAVQDTLYSCEAVVLDAGIGYSGFNWSTGEQTQTITVNAEGVYGVDLVNACGVYNTSYVVNHPHTSLYNLITPNDDGKNDYLYFAPKSLSAKLSVYNAWGVRVYEDNDYKNDWNAKDLSHGIYYYQFNYEGCPVVKNWVHVFGEQ